VPVENPTTIEELVHRQALPTLDIDDGKRSVAERGLVAARRRSSSVADKR
jgi:hypothetical protein